MRGTTDFARKRAVVRMLAHSKAPFFQMRQDSDALGNNDNLVIIWMHTFTFSIAV